ncbi:MAG: flippase-like domain-containing protein [Gemmatimonadales bacterium]|nr:flippase-like domain-containing protein [Gemmatimonadales bacterium]NIN12360.1 flippase-like domain-containing protein [Gemmatimonadales bacterium]NIN48898.1 flippase-like domain-containing protein [Gemmatimonadales bacterium]NIP06362.1 flippase-like domain-containing protein [Gemmatimonadales bacterium]NIR00735.1 flippase-like domain-containing protein [Gemmatimonadales bacterium]
MSIVLLWWTLHDVAISEVWARLRGVRIVPLLGTVALATAAFPVRTVRWRCLLRIDGNALPFVPLWHATAIGFMANNLLPARAGEFARAYAARRLTAARFSTAFASIVAERVLDGIVLVALLTIAIWAGGFAPDTVVGGVTLGSIVRGAGAVFGILLILALLLVHWPDPALRLASRVAGFGLPTRWADRMMQIMRGLLSGLEGLRGPWLFVTVTFWSFAVWIIAAASFWLAFQAFDIRVPLSAALLLQGLIAMGVAIPSSPGFFGPFEAVIRVSLALYGVDAGRAVSYAVGYHLATFLPITLLGIWSLSRAHLHMRELRTAEANGIESQGP